MLGIGRWVGPCLVSLSFFVVGGVVVAFFSLSCARLLVLYSLVSKVGLWRLIGKGGVICEFRSFFPVSL